LKCVDTRYILILEVMTMYTTLQKWGNSQAIRIPKSILEKANLKENDPVELKVEDGNLIIIPLYKHMTLKERIAAYGEAEAPSEEWDTGKPKGKEVW